ncbi:hypothetical protein CU666_21090 [Pseudomonas syringae pv. actinidifoliorum]|nr:hypothetical protein [Pseudomonas syringae pv. theae]NAT60375.1 hypothetical protein [Pseudomonas syringae pv. actinidifoliorum]
MGANLFAKGCEAALKQATLVVPDTPYVTVLLPVPGRSRTSSLPRPTGRSKSGFVPDPERCHDTQPLHATTNLSKYFPANSFLLIRPRPTVSPIQQGFHP